MTSEIQIYDQFKDIQEQFFKLETENDSNFQKIAPFLCSLCMSMIDDQNEFYLNRCCQSFNICRPCMLLQKSRIEENKLSQLCPFMDCSKNY